MPQTDPWGSRYGSGILGAGNLPQTTERTPFLFPGFNPKSGFKLGLGGYLDPQSVQLYAQYTLLYNKDPRGNYSRKKIDTSLYEYATIQTYYANVFQRIDLVLRREFCLGAQMVSTPAAGLLFGYDEQWIGAQMLDYNSPGSLSASIFNAHIRNWQRWWGLGPYIQIDSEVFFRPMEKPMNFGLLFDVGAALPWSQFKWRSRATYPNVTTATVNAVPTAQSQGYLSGGNNIRNTLWALSPMVEMSLGLKWTQAFGPCYNRLFSLSAAWEEQIWLSHNYIRSDDTISIVTPLSYLMQGLTVSAKLDF